MAKPTGADRAALALEAAIARHAGWQLQYDMQLVIEDRKRLLARIAELEAQAARFTDGGTPT